MNHFGTIQCQKEETAHNCQMEFVKQGLLSTSTSVLNLVTADHSDTSARD